MVQDIEEFLRMAAARKKQQQGQQPQQAAPPPTPPSAPPSAPHPVQPPPPPQHEATPRLDVQDQSMFYISDDEQPQRRTKHQRLESMVKPTVSTQDISEHASHLGEGVQSRHVVDSATEHKFDTDLGSLQKEDLGTPSVVDQGRGIENLPDYHVVLEMLKNPKSLRHAIILKEIFDRPRFD